MLYVIPHFIGRIFDLFHITPLLSLTKHNLSIRTLFGVRRIPWEDVNSVRLRNVHSFGNRGQWLDIRYKRKKEDGTLADKKFSCNASVLTVTVDSLVKLFSEHGIDVEPAPPDTTNP